MARGINLVFTNCKDPARHEEFNRWYSHTHLPDLKGAKGLVGARRFVNANPGQGPGQYLAIYEFDSDDLAASRASLQRFAQDAGLHGRNIDCLEIAGVYVYREMEAGQYKPLEKVDYPPWPMHPPRQEAQPPKLPAATLPKGISYVLTDCTDPAREEEFNRWYFHTHLPDLSVRPGQARATRYHREQPERGPSTYMAVYEWLGEDLRKTTAQAMKAVSHIFEHRHIDCLKFVGNMVFQEIDAKAYKPLEKVSYPTRQPS
jgi:hypothetical protein